MKLQLKKETLSVRLYNPYETSPLVTEGLVQIRYNNTWLLTRYSSLTTTEAKVVCKQLGLERQDKMCSTTCSLLYKLSGENLEEIIIRRNNYF